MLYASKEMKASKAWADKKCFYCGEYFKAGEGIILLVPSYEVRKKYDKLSLNAVMHLAEYNRLKANMTNEEFIEHLGNHKQGRKKMELTEAQLKNMRVFKEACYGYGFRVEVNALQREHLIKQRKSGTSITLQYNPLTDQLSVRTKIRNKSLFDRLFEAELVAKIYNKMHELLGDGKVDNFTASGLISGAIEEAHKIIGD